MADTNHHDPYAFMLDLCRISSSQEELLRRCPFVGETLHSHHDKPSPSTCEFLVASAGIVMVSLPETQECGKDSGGPQDVFHTPPEESSLPTTSDEQRRMMAFDHCAVNQAVGVEDGTQGFVDLCGYSEGAEFVDLGRDSDLGFSEVQLTQGIDGELVAECSRGIEGDGVSEISKCQFDEFGVLERELSSKDNDDGHLGESPLKKLKLSEQSSGFGSSRDGFGTESQKVEEGMGNCEGKMVPDTDTESPCNFGADLQPQKNGLPDEQMSVDPGKEDNACRDISMDENLGSHENVKTQVVQSETIGSAGDANFCEADKFPCTVEENKSSDDKVIETSERQKRSDEQIQLRVLPSSIRQRLENAAKELESGEGREEVKSSIFDVLKVLSQNSDEDSIENVSLLEAAKIRGITFPSPRWGPHKDGYKRKRLV